MPNDKEFFQIEMGRGATYSNGQWTVYRYSVYPRHSVLAGQQCRTYIKAFESLEEAQAAYPQAKALLNGGTGYRAPDLSHLPDDEDYY